MKTSWSRKDAEELEGMLKERFSLIEIAQALRKPLYIVKRHNRKREKK